MKKKDIKQIGRRDVPKSPASNIITYGQGQDSKMRVGGSEKSVAIPTGNLIKEGK